VRFSDTELEAWKRGDYSLVSDCSGPLGQILRKKACVRPGSRFFGEAKVAATAPHIEGWYSSFKWLTSRKWCSARELGDEYQTSFRDALMRHFPDLKEFQLAVGASMARLGDRKPVGPDLWLTARDEHRFIEVKLPGDRLGRHQMIGLALIAMFLRSDRPVSVEVVHLYTSASPERSEQYDREFKAICAQLTTAKELETSGGGTKCSKRGA